MASIKKTALSSVSKVLRSIKDTMEAKKKATFSQRQIKKIASKPNPVGGGSNFGRDLHGNVGSVKGGEISEVREFANHIGRDHAKSRNNVKTLIGLKEIADAKKKLKKGNRDLRLDEKQIKGRKRLNDPARNRKIPDRRTGQATGPNEIDKSHGKATRAWKKEVKKAFKKAIDRRRSLKE
jgi:hypothetical protein